MPDRDSENPSANVPSSAPKTSADALVASAKAGSREALDQLIERLSEQLWRELGSGRRANGMGPSRGLSDLVQDTLVRVREQFDRFESQTFEAFTNWARSVLYRRQQEWARKYRTRNAERHKRRIWNALCQRTGDEAMPPLSALERREERNRAFAIFKKLKSHEQFLIDLRLLSGLTFKQIAAMTHSTEDAARKAYHRAIDKLRAKYRQHDSSP